LMITEMNGRNNGTGGMVVDQPMDVAFK
jgi:hypothetical protein